MVATGPMPLGVRAALGCLAVLTVLYAAQVTFIVIPRPDAFLFEKLTCNAVAIGAAALCAWRAIAVRAERAAWLCFAGGLLAWAAGNVYFAVALRELEDIPIPSVADAGYLGLYPGLFAGLVLLFGARGGGRSRSWVDGALGALAMTAIAAALVYGPLVDALHGATLEVAVGLAYPLCDLLLLGLVGGALAISGWRMVGAWAWIAVALAIFAVCDALYAYTNAIGTYGAGWFFDAGWPIAALLLALAAWLPVPALRASTEAGRWSVALPLSLAAICLILLVYDHFSRLNLLALALATTALVAVLVRLAIAFADNRRMLLASRRDALTDGLTGLGNRRALMAELEHALASEAPVVLGLFDLDGFKHYNDTFGHAAGDALLERLGLALARKVDGRGRAYRLGGDEFCVIAAAGHAGVASTVTDAAASLTERGETWAVGCSFGSVLLPHEAVTAAAALRLADQRMYLEKQAGRPTALSQSRDVLVKALSERYPDLEPHMGAVAELADAVARRLGLPDAQVAEARLAGELHDVGKVAVPEVILDKPGPLDEQEWLFMRRHTLIGERIVAAAPALSSVARIVRASHERLDGSGYPDGLKGAGIPLAARIVFACDAFEAMTSDRPYSAASPDAAALAELRRCAGSQFDPVVVEALCGVIAEGRWSGARLTPRGSERPSPA